jgi:hypothetical protein
MRSPCAASDRADTNGVPKQGHRWCRWISSCQARDYGALLVCQRQASTCHYKHCWSFFNAWLFAGGLLQQLDNTAEVIGFEVIRNLL